MAHESGHLLGLPDEYDYGGSGGSYRNLNPQPPGQPQSIMAQTWSDVAALQSHIDAITGALNAKCPWWCCILRWLLRVIFRRRFARPLTPRMGLMHRDVFEDLSGRPTGEILARMEGGNPDILGRGMEVLRRVAAEQPDALMEELRSESPIRRWAVASALADSDTPQVREQLVGALRDPDVRVRVAAAASLARLGSREGATVLIDALASDEVMLGHPPELVADYPVAALRSAGRWSRPLTGL